MNDTYNCNIVKDDTVMSWKTGTLEGVTYDDLIVTLGEPNLLDDPGKVRWSWGFKVLPSVSPMALWDWKGSGDRDTWSIYGNCDTWRKLFPEATIKSGI
tara:strand:+ start:242 stop:538 length:297 start_codon:yes stop_codon:yes gene_type:complete